MLRRRLKSDPKFNIDKDAYINIFRRPILFYKIVFVPVGKIRRVKGNKIVSLTESCAFKWLNNECSEEEYIEYCKNNNYDKSNRSPELFSQLSTCIRDNGYKIECGTIVIDQYNCIIDGLHRSVYILKTYGKDYLIPVLKIYYLYRTPRGIIMNIKYKYEKRMEKNY